MNQRSSDNLHMPTMTPAKDELVSRRNGSVSKARSKPDSKATGSSLLTWIALVIAIAATGAAYFLWEQNNQLLNAVDQADKRISSLEAQLTSTGDELTQSDAAVRVQLKELDLQVAKLWDARKVSNKSISDQAGKVKNISSQTTKLSDQSKSNAAQLTALSAELDEMLESVATIDPENLNSRLDAVSLRLSSIDGSVKTLESDIADNAQWLKSIDGFRRQVNQRLNAIQNPAAEPPKLQ